jgi:hypothetical protein
MDDGYFMSSRIRVLDNNGTHSLQRFRWKANLEN